MMWVFCELWSSIISDRFFPKPFLDQKSIKTSLIFMAIIFFTSRACRAGQIRSNLSKTIILKVNLSLLLFMVSNYRQGLLLSCTWNNPEKWVEKSSNNISLRIQSTYLSTMLHHCHIHVWFQFFFPLSCLCIPNETFLMENFVASHVDIILLIHHQ